MLNHRWVTLVAGVLVGVGGFTGCGKDKEAPPPLPPPQVTISQPIQREVTDYVDFTGRTEAQFSVDIKARVTGYLLDPAFREGSEVKVGDLLFEIDPRPYQAALDKAQADLTINEAKYQLAKDNNEKAKNTAKMNVGAISQKELDQYGAEEQEAKGAVAAAKAEVESAQINLDFCKLTSPIDGRTSRYYFTIGNLINQDTTLLTTVVSEDPIYAYFDVDEMTRQKFARELLNEKEDLMAQHKFPVYMQLVDEDAYKHTGYVDFANNQFDASTGTIRVRGVFQNPAGASGRRLLVPGMFVRIRLPTDDPHPALLVAEKAISTDQGKKFLYLVINKDGKRIVKYQPIVVGALQDDGLREIKQGLKADDWVITSGLQLVQPGAEVRVNEQPMAPSPMTDAADTADTEMSNEPSDVPAATKSDKPAAAAEPSQD